MRINFALILWRRMIEFPWPCLSTSRWLFVHLAPQHHHHLCILPTTVRPDPQLNHQPKLFKKKYFKQTLLVFSVKYFNVIIYYSRKSRLRRILGVLAWQVLILITKHGEIKQKKGSDEHTDIFGQTNKRTDKEQGNYYIDYLTDI